MAFIPAPNTAMVELVYLWQDQVCENTLYFKGADEWTEANMPDLYSELFTWWSGSVKPLQGVDISLQEIKITSLESDTAISFAFTDALPIFGDQIGQPLPSNCSLAVSFRTLGRGRSSRGRNYWLGLTENQTNGSVVDGGLVADIKDAYTLLITSAVTANGAVWSVVSRFHDHAPRTEALVIPITSVSIIDPFVDSQRRRLPARGR